VRGWVGNGAERLVERALTGNHDGHSEPDQTARGLALFKQAYGARLVAESRVYPGVRETLVALRSAGIPLAVVTNKPVEFAAGLLAGLELDDFFAQLLGGDSLSQRKPHALPLQHVAHLFGAEVTSGLMVGDSATDIGAARAAGMPVLCVDYGYHQGVDLAAEADVLVSELSEMLALLSLSA
jgi:phosphoglycolate phosphatase